MRRKYFYTIALMCFTFCTLSGLLWPKADNDFAHFEFEAIHLCPIPIDTLELLSQKVYQYVCHRMDTLVATRIHISFEIQNTANSIRGLAFHSYDPPQITIFINQNVNKDYILGVLAHEIGHVIHAKCFNGQLTRCNNLNEGLATWLAGKYWLTWHNISSFSKGISSKLNNKQYFPLNNHLTHVSYEDVVRRDQAYNEWASFIDFLIKTYDFNRFKKLLNLSTPKISERFDTLLNEIDTIKDLNLYKFVKTDSDTTHGTVIISEEMKNNIFNRNSKDCLLTDHCTTVYGKSFEELRKEWLSQI